MYQDFRHWAIGIISTKIAGVLPNGLTPGYMLRECEKTSF